MAIYQRPVNRFVAGFIGTPPMNFLDGRVVRDDGALAFDEGSVRIALPSGMADRLNGFIDQPLVMGVRPEALSIAAASARNETTCEKCSTAMTGRFCHQCGAEQGLKRANEANPALDVEITLVELLGDEKDVYMTTPARNQLVGRVEAQAQAVEGQTLRMQIDMRGVHLFEPGEVGANVTAGRNGERACAH